MRNPFSIESKADKQYRQNLERWKAMASVTGPADQAVLRTQPREVIELTGPKIEREFSLKAKDSGQLFAVEEKDHSGRDVVRYFGDIKAAFAPFTLPSIPFEVSKVVWHDNVPYIASQLPASVQMARAMAEIGRPER